jgi:hypothetical protein
VQTAGPVSVPAFRSQTNAERDLVFGIPRSK